MASYSSCVVCGEPSDRLYCSKRCIERGNEQKDLARRKADAARKEAQAARDAYSEALRLERSKKQEIPEPLDSESGAWIIPTKGHVVYHFYSGEEATELLYVGRSSNFFARIGSHERDQVWWPQVRLVTWNAYKTAEDAARIEELEIKTLAPLYNKTHNVTL